MQVWNQNKTSIGHKYPTTRTFKKGLIPETKNYSRANERRYENWPKIWGRSKQAKARTIPIPAKEGLKVGLRLITELKNLSSFNLQNIFQELKPNSWFRRYGRTYNSVHACHGLTLAEAVTVGWPQVECCSVGQEMSFAGLGLDGVRKKITGCN